MNQELYPVPKEFREHAHITEPKYLEMYRRSVEDPESFWSEQANAFLTWSGTWKKVLDWNFEKGHIRWFEGGRLNACYNCIDRHLAKRGEQTAIIWGMNRIRIAGSLIANCTNRSVGWPTCSKLVGSAKAIGSASTCL